MVVEVGSMFWFLVNTITETVDRMRRGRAPFRSNDFLGFTDRVVSDRFRWWRWYHFFLA
jgi:hypothetical protein